MPNYIDLLIGIAWGGQSAIDTFSPVVSCYYYLYH